jgi:hypothetical protein
MMKNDTPCTSLYYLPDQMYPAVTGASPSSITVHATKKEIAKKGKNKDHMLPATPRPHITTRESIKKKN